MAGKNLLMSSFVVLTLAAGSAFAKVPKSEADRLLPGGDLTAFGGQIKGNADGSIPAYTGGMQEKDIPASYKGDRQPHPNPFPDDRPLFRITAQNVDQYADKLSPGQIGLFKAYPESFYMDVYQTRRSHSAPDWVNKNTYNNALSGELIEGGNGIANVYGGIPFPIANNGLEMFWNHVTRWRGVVLNLESSTATVQRNGLYSLVSIRTEVDFTFNHPEESFESLNNRLFYFLSMVEQPARLAGAAVLVHETLDQNKEPRQAWTYNVGQRRVRRAPNIAYDTSVGNSDGIQIVDEVDMLNGSPSRFNWKSLGKKEMFIPYNNYKLDDPSLKYDDIIVQHHTNPAYPRYELHRVHVLQADLKDDSRHVYSKRFFFIDEDSWGIHAADAYDGEGNLWRTSMQYSKNFYELKATLSAMTVFHDLQTQRYRAVGLENEKGLVSDYLAPRPNASRYKPASLRRIGRR